MEKRRVRCGPLALVTKQRGQLLPLEGWCWQEWDHQRTCQSAGLLAATPLHLKGYRTESLRPSSACQEECLEGSKWSQAYGRASDTHDYFSAPSKIQVLTFCHGVSNRSFRFEFFVDHLYSNHVSFRQTVASMRLVTIA